VLLVFKLRFVNVLLLWVCSRLAPGIDTIVFTCDTVVPENVMALKIVVANATSVLLRYLPYYKDHEKQGVEVRTCSNAVDDSAITIIVR